MRKVIKILMIVFAILTLLFAVLEITNIFNSSLYTLSLGFVSICEYLLKKDIDKNYSLIYLVIGILLIISFIITL